VRNWCLSSGRTVIKHLITFTIFEKLTGFFFPFFLSNGLGKHEEPLSPPPPSPLTTPTPPSPAPTPRKPSLEETLEAVIITLEGLSASQVLYFIFQ